MSDTITPTPTETQTPAPTPVVPPVPPAVPPVAPAPPQPFVFQLAPPVAPPPAPPVTPVPVEPPPVDYKATVKRYADAALSGLSDADKALVGKLAGDDPARVLDVLTELQASGKLGQAATPAPTPEPTPTPEKPAAIDRSRAGGGDVKPPAPKTLEEANRALARQLNGQRLAF